MNLLQRISKIAARAGIKLLCLMVTPVIVSTAASGQSSALSECTREFYRGDYALSAQLAETHLRKYPKDAPVRVVLARAELAQGKFHEAFDELQKVLAFDSRNIDALYYLSLVSRELSAREYQRLLSLAPDSARVRQLLAESALAAQNYGEAEEEFQKALKVSPNSAEVLTELAELRRSQSKFDEAIAYYMDAEKSGTLNYDVAYGLAGCGKSRKFCNEEAQSTSNGA